MQTINFLCSSVLLVFGISALSSANAAPAEQTAVFAGGCFWGVDAVFKHVKGVTNVESGYAGGNAATAHYDMVSGGNTGHAESVRVRFDPARISYQQLLQVFFSVAHDPTELNRQGPDSGTQYRSAIFYTSPEQQKIAQGYIQQLTAAHKFSAPIVTQVVPLPQFYPAEDLSPELSGTASLPAVYRVQRHAQAGAITQTISGVVSMRE